MWRLHKNVCIMDAMQFNSDLWIFISWTVLKVSTNRAEKCYETFLKKKKTLGWRTSFTSIFHKNTGYPRIKNLYNWIDWSMQLSYSRLSFQTQRNCGPEKQRWSHGHKAKLGNPAFCIPSPGVFLTQLAFSYKSDTAECGNWQGNWPGPLGLRCRNNR